jgi:hypothetical protein
MDDPTRWCEKRRQQSKRAFRGPRSQAGAPLFLAILPQDLKL